MNEQICTKCRETKPDTEFYGDKHSKTGLQHACKACMKGYSARYREKHPDYYKNKGKARYAAASQDPEFNRKRYQEKREEFIARNDAVRSSREGRAYDLWSNARTRTTKHGREFEKTLS